MKRKRIYLNKKNTKYCIVKLFNTRREMQEAYFKRKPSDDSHFYTLGVHIAYTIWDMETKKCGAESGTIMLSLENCGSGVVCHEIMHAVLWAHRHKKYKKQHPIIIKSMREEEEILYNFSYAIEQFYKWYWKVVEIVDKS